MFLYVCIFDLLKMYIDNLPSLELFFIMAYYLLYIWCSNIPTPPAYGVYISRLIRYSRACGSYHEFLDKMVAANKETTEPRVPSG